MLDFQLRTYKNVSSLAVNIAYKYGNAELEILFRTRISIIFWKITPYAVCYL